MEPRLQRGVTALTTCRHFFASFLLLVLLLLWHDRIAKITERRELKCLRVEGDVRRQQATDKEIN